MISFYKFLLASLLLPTVLAAEIIKVGGKIEDVRRNLSSLGYQEGEKEFLNNVILGQLDDPVGPASKANHPELWRVGNGYLFILHRNDTRLVTALYFFPVAKEKVEKKIEFEFSVTSFDPMTGQLVIEIGTPEAQVQERSATERD
jgi:hypothetical protein